MIYIIIPNYNGKHHLEVCLKSLIYQTYTKFKVVIVDNGSSDLSTDFIRTNFPDFKIIEMNENTGFSKAVNAGIRMALEDASISHILLLNNDIECEKNFLEELVKSFENEQIASASPKMLNYFNRNVIDDTGNFISKKSMPFPRGQGEKDIGQYNKREYIFGACAGAAIYKKEVFERIGYFDEDFFAYYEDLDFSFRLQLCGFKCIYNPKAICFHKRGGTMSSNSNFHIFLIERNLFTLRLKNFPLSLLVKYFIYFNLARSFRFSQYLLFKSPSYFFAALRGYLNGVFMLPKTLIKRRKIMSKKTVDVKYIKSILK